MSDEPLQPDEVLAPGRPGDVAIRDLVRDLALMVPNIVKLLARLVRDPRVPRRSKLLVGGLVAYLASPIDLIPDAIPVLGMADDVLLAVYAINHLVEKAGEDVVEELWDGPGDLLEMVRGVLDSVSGLIPPPIKRWVDRLSG